MDQAEPRPSSGQPGPDRQRPDEPARKGQPSRTPPPEAAETGARVPDPAPHAELQAAALRLEHPVIAGYDGSEIGRAHV